MFNLYTPGMSAHLLIFCSYQVEVAALRLGVDLEKTLAAANAQDASAQSVNVHPAAGFDFKSKRTCSIRRGSLTNGAEELNLNALHSITRSSDSSDEQYELEKPANDWPCRVMRACGRNAKRAAEMSAADESATRKV